MKIRKAPIKRPQFNKDSIHRVHLRCGQVFRQVLIHYRQGIRSGEKCALGSVLLSDVFKSKHQSYHYLWIYSFDVKLGLLSTRLSFLSSRGKRARRRIKTRLLSAVRLNYMKMLNRQNADFLSG